MIGKLVLGLVMGIFLEVAPLYLKGLLLSDFTEKSTNLSNICRLKGTLFAFGLLQEAFTTNEGFT